MWKVLVVSSLVISSVFAQCANLGVFNDCVNQAGLSIAACSAAVKDVPDITYYECQCTEYTKQLRCYYQCPDDPNLQLQFRTTQSTASSICSAVDMMKLQGNTKTASSTSTTSRISTSTPPALTTTKSNTGGTTTTPSGGATTTEDTPSPTATPFSGLTANSAHRKVNSSELLMTWTIIVVVCLYFVL